MGSNATSCNPSVQIPDPITFPFSKDSMSDSAAQRESGSSSRAASDTVPVLSVAALGGSDMAAKRELAAQLNAACRDVGFLVIVDHGVPQDVIRQCWGTTREYFDLPEEQKRKDESDDMEAYPYGYCPMGAETLQAGKDKETGDVRVVPGDLKESFSIGPYNPEAGALPPRWPAQPPQFQRDWLAYYQEMEKLSIRFMRGLALALDLPEEWFDKTIDKHRSAIRALNYPDTGRPPLPGQLRASAHTDYGAVTFLLADNAPGGLQIQTHSGEWKDVPHVENSFVVNLGDLMARWTNDQWRSTMHRVVNPPTEMSGSCRRQSMAFFLNVNADLLVECIPTCKSEDGTSRYEPIRAYDFLMQKHLASVGKY